MRHKPLRSRSLAKTATNGCGGSWAGAAVLALCCVILLSVPSKLQAENPENTFAFAESLFAEGDYFRAITEYKRVLFFSPQEKTAVSCRFRIGESYYRAKRWEEAIESFRDFAIRYPDDPRTAQALYLKGLAEKELKRFDAALETFAGLMKDNKVSELSDRAAYQTALVYIEAEDWEKAAQSLKRIPGDSPVNRNATRLAAGLGEIGSLPRKSPGTAGLLAAVLPGAGHLYTERPKSAAVAFLLNATFIAAAVELFRKDNNVLGGIVTFVEAGWYIGNIYSAANSAHKYNKNQKDEFLKRLKDETALSLRYDPQNSGMIMAMQFRF